MPSIRLICVLFLHLRGAKKRARAPRSIHKRPPNFSSDAERRNMEAPLRPTNGIGQLHINLTFAIKCAEPGLP